MSQIVITLQPPANKGDAAVRLVNRVGRFEVWENLETGQMEPFIEMKFPSIKSEVKNFQYTNNTGSVSEPRPLFPPFVQKVMLAHFAAMLVFLSFIVWLTRGAK